MGLQSRRHRILEAVASQEQTQKGRPDRRHAQVADPPQRNHARPDALADTPSGYARDLTCNTVAVKATGSATTMSSVGPPGRPWPSAACPGARPADSARRGGRADRVRWPRSSAKAHRAFSRTGSMQGRGGHGIGCMRIAMRSVESAYPIGRTAARFVARRMAAARQPV